MHNNLGYGGFSSSNSSNLPSFQSPYSSTPNNNSTRFQRPRFAYAGPPSYPRPRSSASKPNPDPYDGEDFQSLSYDSEADSRRINSIDYSPGYMDSMRNNYGDTNLPLNESLTMNRSSDSYSDSSSYYTCNESFYQTPLKPDYDSNDSPLDSSNRGGHSSFTNLYNPRKLDTYSNTAIGGSALYNTNAIGLSTETLLQGKTGVFATSTIKGTIGLNTRGNRGTFGQNRGNARGRFQTRRPFRRGSGGSRFPKPSMDALKPFSNWRCETCSINFTSQIPFDMHLRGSRHAKKLKTLNAMNWVQEKFPQVKEVDQADGKRFYCELCSVVANSSVQLQMHLDGTKHKIKLQSTEIKKEPAVPKETAETESEELNGKSNGGGVRRPAPVEFGETQPTKMTKFSCDICNIIVNSDIQLQQHLSSKKHQARVEGKSINKRRKGLVSKQDGESAQPIEQSEEINKGEQLSEETNKGEQLSEETNKGEQLSEETNKDKTNKCAVIGVKTLSASFVKSDTML